MPLIEITTFESRLTAQHDVDAVAAAVPDALCAVIGEEAREETWLVFQGIPPTRWAFGGRVLG